MKKMARYSWRSLPRHAFLFFFAALSMLLPVAGVRAEPGEFEKLPWTGDLAKGLKEAKDKGGLVFVDFTGEGCVNCKKNERFIFARREVLDLLRQYTLVQLYGDRVPDRLLSTDELRQSSPDNDLHKKNAQRNAALQESKFTPAGQDLAQPLYVVLRPSNDGGYAEVARYDLGFVPKEDFPQFVDFLRAPLRTIANRESKAVGKNITLYASISRANPYFSFGVAGLLGSASTPMNLMGAPAFRDYPVLYSRGELAILTIRGVPRPGWHTYSIRKLAPGQNEAYLSKLTLASDQFGFIGPTDESEPSLVDEETLGKQYQHTGPFTWSQVVIIKPGAPSGQPIELTLACQLQVCDKKCYKEDLSLHVPVLMSTEPALSLSTEVQGQLKKWEESERLRESREKPSTGSASPSASTTLDFRKYEIEESDESISKSSDPNGLFATILKALAAGFISLVTPCVFPMIPVTVSIFLKRGQVSGPRPLTMALVYCGTIVVVMSAGGIALVSVLATISQHWATNIFLTAIFVFFALSLLGMYEIQLPSSLANLTGSKQGQSGLIGIVFMALTFSIISFACVGPIYGGFITLEASGGNGAADWLPRILGPVAFSVAFASPFFFLALFPSLLKSMPKSGSWMNSVKVVMGFLELAAAFKFVRAAEMNFYHKSEYFTFDLCLAAYIVLAIACGLYLLNVYRLPHDHEVSESIGVGRLMTSLIFLTFGIYLLPGLFKDEHDRSQRVRGLTYQWVRAFLLPEDPSDWNADLGAAIAQSRKENKPIFIDFTGVACNNCKLNEDNIFSRPKIQQTFREFVTVRLFVSPVPDGVQQVPNGADTEAFRTRLGNEALPYYIILKPVGENRLKKIAYFKDGVIRDADEFDAFLRKALVSAAKVNAQ